MSHGIGRITAVSEHVLEGLITAYTLVLAKSYQQISKSLFGNLAGIYGLSQCYKNWMPGDAGITGLQLRFPTVQKFERLGGISNFIAKVVGNSAIGVNVVEMLPQATR